MRTAVGLLLERRGIVGEIRLRFGVTVGEKGAEFFCNYWPPASTPGDAEYGSW